MKVNKLGEFGLIERIRSAPALASQEAAGARPRPDGHRGGQHAVPSIIGIGDDTAAIEISPTRYLLWTTDILIEGIHFFSTHKLSTFNFQLSTGFMLGWKSLAVNISDIAAMGGIPKYALVTLGLTGNEDVKFIDDLYRGMNALSQFLVSSPLVGEDKGEGGVQILGGDTSKSPVLVIDVTVIGEVEKKNL